MSILAKYHTYHLVDDEPEMTKAETIVFDILDELRTMTAFNVVFEELSEEKQSELIDALLTKTNANLPRRHGIGIIGISDLHVGTLMHEAMMMPLIIVDDRPMEIVRLEVEDLMTDIDILKIAPKKPKKTFVMPHTKKRGNSWDGMR